MRFICIVLVATLLWSYYQALVRLRTGRFPLTPIMGWMVGIGYFMLAPLMIFALNGGYTIPAFYEVNDRYASIDLSSGTYFLPVFVVWLALMLSFQAIIFFLPKAAAVGPAEALPLNEEKIKRILLVTFGLSLIDYVISIYISGGIASFLISHWYARQEELFARLGESYVLYSRLSMANQIVFVAASALCMAWQLQRRRVDWKYTALILFALLLQMVMSGNRIFIALFGLAFLTLCWGFGRKKLLLVLFSLSPVVLIFFGAWAYLRHDLTAIADSASTYTQQDLGNRVTTTLVDTTEGASIMLLLHMVNDFGGKFDYFYGSSYSKAVTFIVPRSIYPKKPPNFPALLAQFYEPGQLTSLGATQLGELYANFGPISVLLLPLITLGLMFWSNKIEASAERKILLSTVLFLLLAWAVLASFEDSFITFLFAFLLMRAIKMERAMVFSGARIETSGDGVLAAT